MVFYAIDCDSKMPKRKGRARLLISSKLTLESGYIQEIKIWETLPSTKYPDGIRYRLALVNLASREIAVLYDNHWPKGDHVHVGKTETPYRFESVEQLLQDFFGQVEQVEGTNDENKEN